MIFSYEGEWLVVSCRTAAGQFNLVNCELPNHRHFGRECETLGDGVCAVICTAITYRDFVFFVLLCGVRQGERCFFIVSRLACCQVMVGDGHRACLVLGMNGYVNVVSLAVAHRQWCNLHCCCQAWHSGRTVSLRLHNAVRAAGEIGVECQCLALRRYAINAEVGARGTCGNLNGLAVFCVILHNKVAIGHAKTYRAADGITLNAALDGRDINCKVRREGVMLRQSIFSVGLALGAMFQGGIYRQHRHHREHVIRRKVMQR